jgi:hypothetical protein
MEGMSSTSMRMMKEGQEDSNLPDQGQTSITSEGWGLLSVVIETMAGFSSCCHSNQKMDLSIAQKEP